jgi:ubiquinone/menaquinone biosynthesis C-methylase UbiE
MQMLFYSFISIMAIAESYKMGFPKASVKSNTNFCRTCSKLSATIEKAVISIPVYADDVPQEGTMFQSPIFKIFDFFLGIPIFHDILFGVYRKQIVEKSEKMGLPWKEFMSEQWDSINNLRALADLKEDPNLVIPDYYYAPIHAYKDGNLCWDSAMEEDLWSKLMIAPLYDNALDGDVQMRQEWLKITGKAIKPNPKFATDLGCGTGLSMYMLDSKFPSLEYVQGVDMSTFKLAVCEDKKSMMPEAKGSKYEIRHEAAEKTIIPSGTQDLASLCLVAHESPRWVSKAIFDEAYRILKPGGSFTMLDLDKENLEVLLENPFVAAIYKRTEPYMQEFLNLDPMKDLAEAGFVVTSVGQASRSHRVYVAQKPENADSLPEAKLAEQGLLQ